MARRDGLIPGDDGLPAEEVGSWAREKHECLRRYIDISRGARKKFIGPKNAGATYIDLFCGTGRAKIRRSKDWIDGGAVSAWKISVAGGAPFSAVYVSDLDDERRGYAVERLRRAGAPVHEVPGGAMDAAQWLAANLSPYALHFAFIDPYSLGAFRFEIIEALSFLKRIDMLVHVSRMDLQRNVWFNMVDERQDFDLFAPGWRDSVDLTMTQSNVRRAVFDYWQTLVARTGIDISPEMRLIRAGKGQPLYWLLLAAKHKLPLEFWKTASVSDQFAFKL